MILFSGLTSNITSTANAAASACVGDLAQVERQLAMRDADTGIMMFVLTMKTMMSAIARSVSVYRPR